MLLMIRSVGSKNISFSSLKSNISQNLILTIIFFLREAYIVNCTTNLFSYHAKNVKNRKNEYKSWRIHLNIFFSLVE